MAREQWAKVDVDMPTDEKLYGRPLLERHLWTCLICLSKKRKLETDSYAIHNLDAAALSHMFNLGSPAKVEKALKYFETCKPRPMLKRSGGAILLINVEKRQAPTKDNPEAVAERQRRWREAHPRHGSAAPLPAPLPPRDSSRDTARDASVTRNVDEDLEEEEEKEEPDPDHGTGSEKPRELSVAWPRKLLADLHRALGRKQLETSDRQWQDFVTESLKFPIEIRQQAALEYIRRGATPGQHSPAYVLAMIRDGAGGGRASGPTGWEIPGPEETTRRLEADLGPPPTPESRARLHAAYEATQLGKKRIRS